MTANKERMTCNTCIRKDAKLFRKKAASGYPFDPSER